jgi:hypothetical protein
VAKPPNSLVSGRQILFIHSAGLRLLWNAAITSMRST